MPKKIKMIMSVLFAVMLSVSVFCVPINAAEDDLKINISADGKSTVTAKVGDTVKYSVYMSDTNEKILGVQMNGFYDSDYLTIVKDSFNAESFPGAVLNDGLKNRYTFAWTDVQNLVQVSDDKPLYSIEFTVAKGGETELSYFISDMYGDDMTYLKSYKITCSLTVNGKDKKTNVTPKVNSDDAKAAQLQGDFVNYVDGMGEENTPNKSNHESVKVEKKYISNNTQNNQNNQNNNNDNNGNNNDGVVDVTKSDGSTVFSNGSGSTTTIIIIIAVVIIVLAAVAIIIVKKRDDKSKSEDTPKNE